MAAFDVDEALRRYLTEERAKLRQRHIATPPGRRIHGSDLQGYDGHQRDLSQIDSMITSLRISLAKRHFYIKEQEADAIIGKLEATEEQRIELALGLLKVDMEVLEQSREWLKEGLIADIGTSADPKDAQVVASPSQPNEAPVTKPPKRVEQGPKFSKILPRFLKQMTDDEGWRGQTLQQNKATYRMFAEHCGDKPVQDYTRKHCTSFFDVLKEMPRDYGQRPEYRNLNPRQIAEMKRNEEVERIGMKTVKRHASALGKLFTYLKKRGDYEGENPAHGHDFPLKKRKNEGRDMWEGQRLEKLFKSPVWLGCHSQRRRSKPGGMIIKDGKYWLPLLSVYHGNRLEEFAQLLRSDVRQEDGIWYFDINEDEDGKQLKNEQSKRRVPIHPALIKIGFLGYVKQAAPNPENRVFPELRPGGKDNRKGFYFTKWWSQYRKQIGVGEKGYDYHSFRHGVETKLVGAGINSPIINQLLGHEGKGTGERVYLKGKSLPLQVLSEAIAKIEWPELEWLLG